MSWFDSNKSCLSAYQSAMTVNNNIHLATAAITAVKCS